MNIPNYMCHDQQRVSSYGTWTETMFVIKYVFTDCMGKVQCLQQVVSVLAFCTALTAITLMLAGFNTKCDVKA